MKTEPAQILMVHSVPSGTKDKPDPSTAVLSGICDIFSRCGFMIRDGANFIQCPVCDALLPTKEAFRKLTVKPPFPWQNTCRYCADKPRIEEISSDEEPAGATEEKKECMT